MKHFIIILLALIGFSSCEEDFFERFPPEIMYYQYDVVETADFNKITLEAGVTEYTLKARISAPNELALIQVYREDKLLRTVNDFSKEAKPTEYFMTEVLTNITGKVVIRTEATDKNGKKTIKTFTVN